MIFARRRRSALPGFRLTLGITLVYLCLMVLIPLSTVFVKSASMTSKDFWGIVTRPSVVAAFKLSLWTSLVAACVNLVFGLLVAWVITRYKFPGRRILDALVDLPFALPTAVAGICLTTLYAPTGWIGQYLTGTGFIGKHFGPDGIKVAYAPMGIVVALVFIGIPFVVRTVQPVLEDLDEEIEEAAASLGATRRQTFIRVIAPTILPALLTGFALAFARAVGEYGSVVFISGNLPMKTEIAPLAIMSELEQYNVPGATAIALVMLAGSFVMLLIVNLLQYWSSKRTGVVGA